MIDAVLFDLYETLVTESTTRPTRASSLGERFGIEPKAFRNEWKARRPRVVTGQLSFADALAEICRKLTGRVDMAAIERAREERVREKSAAFERIDHDVAAGVAALVERGIVLGVISNGFEEDTRAWPAFALAQVFKCAVFSCVEGVAKPDPEIYRRALHRLGVASANALYVGDGSDDELSGAEWAGLRALRATWFAPDGHGDRSTAMTLERPTALVDLVS